jgi:hypothetical protein
MALLQFGDARARFGEDDVGEHLESLGIGKGLDDDVARLW